MKFKREFLLPRTDYILLPIIIIRNGFASDTIEFSTEIYSITDRAGIDILRHVIVQHFSHCAGLFAKSYSIR